MKIAILSDLHLEFGLSFSLDNIDKDADVLVLAGDICVWNDLRPLTKLLMDWKKPVLYVAGNHEYYTDESMSLGKERFLKWVKDFPNVMLLDNNSIRIDGVDFFGGTMWTSFGNSCPVSMQAAALSMNDYVLIKYEGRLKPSDTVEMHNIFLDKLIKWFICGDSQPKVVISHHAPVLNKQSIYKKSTLTDAFVSLDMPQIIERYQPDLWIFGHTHENDDQEIGETRIVSNQRGYVRRNECPDFDPLGKIITLS